MQSANPTRTQRSAPTLTHYTLLWLVILVVLSYEYAVLDHVIAGPSLLHALHVKPDPGGSFSFRLGWLGFGTICLTNLYILRKKLVSLRGKGVLSRWLDFHIFCGLLGPTLIVFHTNFKVGGLVAISFWSMMISFSSGVAGRYFYVQLLGEHAGNQRIMHKLEKLVAEAAKRTPALNDKRLRVMKESALRAAGVTPAIAAGTASGWSVIFESLLGDVRVRVPSRLPAGIPRELVVGLRHYAVASRRYHTAGYFRRIMGYWHAFHMPFAIFMYVVTMLHIAAALIFRVNH